MSAGPWCELASARVSKRVELHAFGKRWTTDLARPLPIAIALEFDGPQPNAFGLPSAFARDALGAPATLGASDRLRCDTIELTAHGNGTHTECVSHIRAGGPGIGELLGDLLSVARVVSVEPCAFGDSGEVYPSLALPEDRVITARALRNAIERALNTNEGSDGGVCEALVIRTLPNADKCGRRYGGTNPAYLTLDAIRYIRALGVDHLVLDVPSADREHDAGVLAVHREFWGLCQGEPAVSADAWRRTITELAFISDAIADGPYLLSIQVPRFMLDAAPSRPVLYAIEAVGSVRHE